jgi:small-conductance mechanosensitive channel
LERFWEKLQQSAEDRWDGLADALVRYGIRIAVALLIIWVTVKVARRVQRLAMRRLPLREDAARYQPLIARAAFLGVVMLGAIVALGALGINQTALAALTGAMVVAVTLALQDVLKNFVAGVYLLVERPFRIGDRIRIAGEEGVVSDIGARTTVLRNDRGQDVQVPNYTFFSSPMVYLSAEEAVAEDSQI